MKLHLPIVLFKSIAVALLVSQPVLAVNDLGVTYGGDTYAGAFSFSFALTAGQLGDSDTSDILAFYWNNFNTSGSDYFNAFTLNYTADGIYLSVGEGNVSNAGTEDKPVLTEDTTFAANSAADRSASFSVALTVGERYIIKNVGADQNQTVTLCDSLGTQLGTVSYNGNMNGCVPESRIMGSLFNSAYSNIAAQAEIWDASSLQDYAVNDAARKISFRACASVEFSPISSAWWTSESPLVSGGYLSFASDDASEPHSLSFRDGASSAFVVKGLEFRELSGLSFENVTGSAVSVSEDLIISGIKDADAESADVIFLSNGTGVPKGGAIAAADVTLEDNGNICFEGNKSSQQGGAIFAEGSVSIKGNGDVTFFENTTLQSGGAIVGAEVTISDNGNVIFQNNCASTTAYSGGGGAISADKVTITNNEDVSFIANYVSADSIHGGAIHVGYGSSVTISNNGNVLFQKNESKGWGAAIYALDCSVTISENQDVTFKENKAKYLASAIYSGENISITDNNVVTFSGNNVGTISAGGNVILSNNEEVKFESNTDEPTIDAKQVTISQNTNGVTFSDNTGDSDGGAIYARSLTISDNGDVVFNGNEALSDLGSASGGAINTVNNLTISGNENVSFVANSVVGIRGAWGALSYARGGALRCADLFIGNNAEVNIKGNSACNSEGHISYGGAIYATGKLSITGNDNVTVSGNYETDGSNYRLRSIYHTGGSMELAAKTGHHIAFYDSVYSEASTVTFNAAYTDAEGMTQKAGGDIVFSGEFVKEHLDAILEENEIDREASAEEIENSRTSIFKGCINLSSGSLQVLDGAKLQSEGLTVAEGSEAIVKVHAAELNLGSHALSMVSGSSLEFADGAKLTATELTITTGATLAVRGSVSTAPLMEQVAALTLSEETVAGFDVTRAVNTGSVSVLEGDLTLESGSLLSLDDAYLELTGDLFFDVAGDEEKIALDIAPGIITESNNQVVLFRVDGAVTFGFDDLTASANNGMVYCVNAEDYFTGNRVTESMKLVYDSSTGMVYLENAAESVPEPTSTTLSLLALAALAARRRRK